MIITSIFFVRNVLPKKFSDYKTGKKTLTLLRMGHRWINSHALGFQCPVQHKFCVLFFSPSPRHSKDFLLTTRQVGALNPTAFSFIFMYFFASLIEHRAERSVSRPGQFHFANQCRRMTGSLHIVRMTWWHFIAATNSCRTPHPFFLGKIQRVVSQNYKSASTENDDPRG